MYLYRLPGSSSPGWHSRSRDRASTPVRKLAECEGILYTECISPSRVGCCKSCFPSGTKCARSIRQARNGDEVNLRTRWSCGLMPRPVPAAPGSRFPSGHAPALPIGVFRLAKPRLRHPRVGCCSPNLLPKRIPAKLPAPESLPTEPPSRGLLARRRRWLTGSAWSGATRRMSSAPWYAAANFFRRLAGSECHHHSFTQRILPEAAPC